MLILTPGLALDMIFPPHEKTRKCYVLQARVGCQYLKELLETQQALLHSLLDIPSTIL